MRGALFESWIISELLKSRYNRRLTSNLYFWRDRASNEVDVLAEHGEALLPNEIKSGQTVTRDYLIGLQKWLALAGAFASKPLLIYAGTAGIHAQESRYDRGGTCPRGRSEQRGSDPVRLYPSLSPSSSTLQREGKPLSHRQA
jgi:hypothetical protein